MREYEDMDRKTYRVTCLKCKGSSVLHILNGTQVVYKDQMPIIAARLRGDMQWGFECSCGNDSRLAREEKPQIKALVQGGAHAVAKIAASLKTKDVNKFRMELV